MSSGLSSWGYWKVLRPKRYGNQRLFLLFLAIGCLLPPTCQTAAKPRHKRSLMKLMMHIRYDPVRLIRINHVYDVTKEIMKTWRDIVPTILMLPITSNLPDSYGITKYISPKPVAVRTVYNSHAYKYPKVHTGDKYPKNPYPRKYLEQMVLPALMSKQQASGTQLVPQNVRIPNRIVKVVQVPPNSNLLQPLSHTKPSNHLEQSVWQLQNHLGNDGRSSPNLGLQYLHQELQRIPPYLLDAGKTRLSQTPNEAPAIHILVPATNDVHKIAKDGQRDIVLAENYEAMPGDTDPPEQSLKLPWPKDYKAQNGNSKSFERPFVDQNETKEGFSHVVFHVVNETMEHEQESNSLDQSDHNPVIWTKHVNVPIKVSEDHLSVAQGFEPPARKAMDFRNNMPLEFQTDRETYLDSDSSNLKPWSQHHEFIEQSSQTRTPVHINPQGHNRSQRLMLILLRKHHKS